MTTIVPIRRIRPLSIAVAVLVLAIAATTAGRAQTADPEPGAAPADGLDRDTGAAPESLDSTLAEIEARIRLLAVGARAAGEEAVLLRRELELREERLQALEEALAESEQAREGATSALAVAEERIALLEGELQSVHARIQDLHAMLAGTDIGHLPPPAAPGRDRRSDIETAPDSVRATLVSLGAESIRHGTLVTIPGELLFQWDSVSIEPEAHERLGELASLLEHYRDRSVLIVGHTDATGNPPYNQRLSERRAEAVADFLAERHGIARERITTVGASDSRPIASNATPEGRSRNRRVEIVIHGPEGSTQALYAAPADMGR